MNIAKTKSCTLGMILVFASVVLIADSQAVAQLMSRLDVAGDATNVDVSIAGHIGPTFKILAPASNGMKSHHNAASKATSGVVTNGSATIGGIAVADARITPKNRAASPTVSLQAFSLSSLNSQANGGSYAYMTGYSQARAADIWTVAGDGVIIGIMDVTVVGLDRAPENSDEGGVKDDGEFQCPFTSANATIGSQEVNGIFFSSATGSIFSFVNIDDGQGGTLPDVSKPNGGQVILPIQLNVTDQSTISASAAANTGTCMNISEDQIRTRVYAGNCRASVTLSRGGPPAMFSQDPIDDPLDITPLVPILGN